MNRYRAYYYRENQLQASQAFAASSDAEAAETVSLLCDACSDVVEVGEVWRGAECIAKTYVGRGSAGSGSDEMARLLGDTGDFRQAVIRNLAEDLSSSWSCIRGSRKLLQFSAGLCSWLFFGETAGLTSYLSFAVV